MSRGMLRAHRDQSAPLAMDESGQENQRHSIVTLLKVLVER
ncbi:MAG TPA: hypothetical protein VKR06_16200 [Ktedonosporobacter sp.]|nr:hypothetical protein [Ktedonosporobacter sp.]